MGQVELHHFHKEESSRPKHDIRGNKMWHMTTRVMPIIMHANIFFFFFKEMGP